ncbi:MAG TPA: GGDEF domain-containing protein [Verrucomicrobiae bacterium]|nr:GGDEF domain-containing protein [Verrucomicrobiae bacterium]
MGNLALRFDRRQVHRVLLHVGGFLLIFLAAYWLRGLTPLPNPILQGYLQITTGLFAFVFAAVTLVRFQGTQDRISLILGSGFLLSGAILTASSVLFFQGMRESTLWFVWAPAAWWISRLLLALLFVAALIVEHFLPRSRHPRLEIAGALFGVLSLTYLITAALRKLPPEASRHPSAIVPNPLHLLPALIFLVALAGYSRRKYLIDSAFDHSIFRAVWLNLAAQLAACQSEKLLDGPFVFAQALNVASYTILLGGALLDIAHVFEKVRHLAASDPLTGLANYRRLLDVLDTETERTLRTGRPFAVLLLDLDGLKKINDTYGHLVGSRALCRVADILRFYCRAIDTAARYGGDEFAVVLPEAREDEAQRVAQRIRETLAADQEQPPISASIGISIYLGEGERVEKLLAEADQNLYEEKARRRAISKPADVSRRRLKKG